MSDQIFELSTAEKGFLKQVASLSIKSRFEEGVVLPDPPTPRMEERLGAFVTLKKNGRLRGCIGNIQGDGPLWKVVADMAKQAAFKDPRFPPLDADEMAVVDLEISILGPLSRVKDPSLVEPGKHGLIIRKGGYSGLLLPQVATEWNWDRETFLDQTCRKAGLSIKCWEDPQTELFSFQAEVF